MAMSFSDFPFLHAHNRFNVLGWIYIKKTRMWFEFKTIDYQILNL